MARIRTLFIALVLLLAVPASASADDPEPGTVRGHVYDESGQPALGACVTTGSYAMDIEPDGGYEFNVGTAITHVYAYNCHGLPDYPYLSPWYYGGGQDQSTAAAIEVIPGGVVYADITVPAAPGSHDELGAVTGHISSGAADDDLYESVFLVNDAGGVYPGFTDPRGILGPDPGLYLVPAPPGEYRLLTKSMEQRDTYLPVYYGTNPRGFAASYQEGETLRIESGKIISGIDIELTPGESRYATSGDSSIYVSPEPAWPGVLMSREELMTLDRVAVYQDNADGNTVADYRFLAIPDRRASGASRVRLMLPASMLGSYDIDTLPVYLGYDKLEACQSDADDDCVAGRSVDLYTYSAGEMAILEIRTTQGGIFQVGVRPQFYDSAESVFAGDILWLADSGITTGCNAAGDMFCPDDVVTRGQMAAFLVRALGLSSRLDDPFVDDDVSIFQGDIEKLAAAGITKGCNPPVNDRFCPNESVTRGQMAAFLVRALGYTDDGGGDLFGDDNGSVFEGAIDKLATAGVTRGCNPPVNDRFCPAAPVTRGQMAAFLHRALGD